MNFTTIARYVTGYLLGFTLFFVVIPYILHALAEAFPEASLFGHPVAVFAAVLLGGIGLFFVLWSNIALFFIGKGGATDICNVAISPRTRHLVETGPYQYTRNPMVFGAFSFYSALAIYWKSLVSLIVIALFFVLARFYLQATEEKRLLKDFGSEYEEYRRRVPMIVPALWKLRKNVIR